MFEWQEQYLTSERSERVKYCFCHENIKFLWMLLEKHPLCHRMCKVTKETSGANKIMRNAVDSTSITFRWTWSNSRQSVFSTTTIAKKTEENGSQSRKSDYLVKSDDVRRGRKSKVRHGRLRAITGGTGVNGLNLAIS